MTGLTDYARERVKQTVFHPEIQALRCVAVGLVIVYHLYPQRLTGGYIGVDVFFVISGYLITSHLVRGFQSGTLSLREFYLRRIRRLLPASLLILGISAVTTAVFVPQTYWEAIARQILASTFYIQNWALATDAVDYLAAAADTSPVQHFWSLSVEEQFYVFWPLLLIVLIAAGRKKPSRGLVVAAGIAVIAVASLAFSAWATNHDRSSAYFITQTRIWEFAVGGLLAVVLTRELRSRNLRSVLSWAGLVAIIGSALVFTGSTQFPGVAALIPVLGTAAVIAAGDPSCRWSPSRAFNLRPVQFVGDISYSLYLWHWPLILLLPFVVTGERSEMNPGLAAAVLVLSVGAAWLTKLFVEDRFRFQGGESVTGSRTPAILVGTGLAMVLVSAVSVGMLTISSVRSETAVRELADFTAHLPSCYGAQDLASAVGCKRDGLSTVHPDPIIADDDVRWQECQQTLAVADVLSCHFGSSDPDAYKVALAGDSHASHWLPTIVEIADDNNWSVTTYLKSTCALSAAVSPQTSCAQWNHDTAEQMSAGDYDLILTSAVSRASFERAAGKSAAETAEGGYAALWQQFKAAGAEVVAIADIPRPSAAGLVDPPACVESRGSGDCSFTRGAALLPDPQEAAARDSNTRFIDMTDLFCDINSRCPAVVGDVMVYRDSNHMTATYARSLADELSGRLTTPGVDSAGR
ncbi:acyltransferase family protein [Arthrobacter agilis]|uniref:acyltransferase family protein n=1 Tax=Arthrobacter agilis TaxID=37921 RepID=UPI0023658018|nr:acyltransferase family protein [Arthrobacter agilis]WDF33525.1 acyltransferase family protein [Arthrobacter agilis]